MWEYKGIEYSNSYISHGRTKGSKNGISTTAGYKAVGNKAVGRFDPTTGRYIYDTAKNVVNTISNAGYNVGYKVGSAIGNGINAVRNGISSLTNRNNAKTTQTQSNVDGATVRTGANTFTFSGNANNAATSGKSQEAYADAPASKSAHGEQYRNSIAEKEAKAEQDRLIKKQQETYASRAAEREAKSEEEALIKKQQETYAKRAAKRKEEALVKKQQETYAERDAKRKEEAAKKEAERQKGIEARGFDPEEVKAEAANRNKTVKESEKKIDENENKASELIDKYREQGSMSNTDKKEFISLTRDTYKNATEYFKASGWTDAQIGKYFEDALYGSNDILPKIDNDVDAQVYTIIRDELMEQYKKYKGSMKR